MSSSPPRQDPDSVPAGGRGGAKGGQTEAGAAPGQNPRAARAGPTPLTRLATDAPAPEGEHGVSKPLPSPASLNRPSTPERPRPPRPRAGARFHPQYLALQLPSPLSLAFDSLGRRATNAGMGAPAGEPEVRRPRPSRLRGGISAAQAALELSSPLSTKNEVSSLGGQLLAGDAAAAEALPGQQNRQRAAESPAALRTPLASYANRMIGRRFIIGDLAPSTPILASAPATPPDGGPDQLASTDVEEPPASRPIAEFQTAHCATPSAAARPKAHSSPNLLREPPPSSRESSAAGASRTAGQAEKRAEEAAKSAGPIEDGWRVSRFLNHSAFRPFRLPSFSSALVLSIESGGPEAETGAGTEGRRPESVHAMLKGRLENPGGSGMSSSRLTLSSNAAAALVRRTTKPRSFLDHPHAGAIILTAFVAIVIGMVAFISFIIMPTGELPHGARVNVSGTAAVASTPASDADPALHGSSIVDSSETAADGSAPAVDRPSSTGPATSKAPFDAPSPLDIGPASVSEASQAVSSGAEIT